MAKPGKWRTITPALYNEIKAASHKTKSGRYKYNDQAVMRKFGIGKTTMQYIRNTANYEEYCRRTDKNLKPRPPFENRVRRKYPIAQPEDLLDSEALRHESDRLDREAEHASMMFGTILLLAFLIGAIAVVTIILLKLGGFQCLMRS